MDSPPWQRRGWQPVVEVAQSPTPCRFAAVPLGKGDNKPAFSTSTLSPLTKGDRREAAGGRGLSHFYHGLLSQVDVILSTKTIPFLCSAFRTSRRRNRTCSQARSSSSQSAFLSQPGCGDCPSSG